MKKLFDNIGKKLKTIAVIVFAVLSLVGIIGGISMINYSGFHYMNYLLGGLALLLAGPVVAFAISCSLYGFGQLIENSDKIVEKLEK